MRADRPTHTGHVGRGWFVLPIWMTFALVATTLAVSIPVSGVVGPTVAPASAQTALQQEYVNRVNAERATEGLVPLVVDPELQAASQSWSENMAQAGQISHAPDRGVGVTTPYLEIDENVAFGDSTEAVWQTFVGDQPHRSLMVRPEQRRIGVGVAMRGNTQYVTHRYLIPGTPSQPRPSTTSPAPTTTRPASTTTQPPVPSTVVEPSETPPPDPRASERGSRRPVTIIESLRRYDPAMERPRQRPPPVPPPDRKAATIRQIGGECPGGPAGGRCLPVTPAGAQRFCASYFNGEGGEEKNDFAPQERWDRLRQQYDQRKRELQNEAQFPLDKVNELIEDKRRKLADPAEVERQRNWQAEAERQLEEAKRTKAERQAPPGGQFTDAQLQKLEAELQRLAEKKQLEAQRRRLEDESRELEKDRKLLEERKRRIAEKERLLDEALAKCREEFERGKKQPSVPSQSTTSSTKAGASTTTTRPPRRVTTTTRPAGERRNETYNNVFSRILGREDKTRVILFVHGINVFNDSTDCGEAFDQMIGWLRGYGFTGEMVKVGYYANDVNCDVNLHNYGRYGDSDSWRQIGKAFSQYVYTKYTSKGIPVDVVGYSMGGLITRAAVYGSSTSQVGFSPPIDVEDAVTLGTPHNGASLGWWCTSGTQCATLHSSHPDIAWLNRNGNPQGRQGTEWTTIGSGNDWVVSTASATNMTIPASQKRVFGDIFVNGQMQQVSHTGDTNYMHNAIVVKRAAQGLALPQQ